MYAHGLTTPISVHFRYIICRAGGSGSFDWRKADWKERMDFTEATVFVREQLESMGVKNISRKELESYTIGKVTCISSYFSIAFRFFKTSQR